MKKKALIVVDYQNDFVYGSLGSDAARNIKKNIQSEVEACKENGDVLIFTQDTHNDNYLSTREGKNLPIEHCIEGSDGWRIVDNLDHFSDFLIRKSTFGTFMWTDLIQQFDCIELIGVMTDICVLSNALILRSMFPEKEIIVNASCCAGTSLEAHKAALLVMKSCQITVIGE